MLSLVGSSLVRSLPPSCSEAAGSELGSTHPCDSQGERDSCRRQQASAAQPAAPMSQAVTHSLFPPACLSAAAASAPLQSSTMNSIQKEKTKMDAKALGNDISNHAEIAKDKAEYKAHKAGVAMGVSEPTTVSHDGAHTAPARSCLVVSSAAAPACQFDC